MKKLFAIVLAFVLMLTCFAACGGNNGTDIENIQKKGKIVIGITDYAPMDYKDDSGQWTGFDAEFARLFAKELGVTCEFYVIADWSKKFFELDTKQIDAVWNGMTITDEALLKEAGQMIQRPSATGKRKLWFYGPAWACAGALLTGIAWLLTALL
jgi:polar amino acid transport system substrate-binding protein